MAARHPGHSRPMEDREDPHRPGDPYYADGGSPFVPLLLTLALLVLILFIFWLITTTSMAAVGAATGSG